MQLPSACYGRTEIQPLPETTCLNLDISGYMSDIPSTGAAPALVDLCLQALARCWASNAVALEHEAEAALAVCLDPTTSANKVLTELLQVSTTGDVASSSHAVAALLQMSSMVTVHNATEYQALVNASKMLQRSAEPESGHFRASVTAISISRCHILSELDALPSIIGDCFPELSAIRMSNCRLHSDGLCTLLGALAAQLTALDFEQSQTMTGSGMLPLLTPAGDSGTSLLSQLSGLSFLNLGWSESSSALFVAAIAHPSLLWLSVAGCKDVDALIDESIPIAALRELDVTACTSLPVASLLRLCTCLGSSLTSLAVAETNVDGECLAALVAAMPSPPILQRLDVSWCDAVTEADLLAVVSACPSLRVLQCRCIAMSPSILNELVCRVTELRTLDLDRCEGVTDEVLQMLVRHSPLVEHLTVSWSMGVTDVGFASVMQGLRNLRTLRVAGCKSLSPAIADIAADMMHAGKVDDLTWEGIEAPCRICKQVEDNGQARAWVRYARAAVPERLQSAGCLADSHAALWSHGTEGVPPTVRTVPSLALLDFSWVNAVSPAVVEVFCGLFPACRVIDYYAEPHGP